MINQNIPVHSASNVTWKGKRGGVFESDLGSNPFARVWNDAADVGFYLQGRNSRKLFLYSGEERSPEGELLLTVFTARDDETLHVMVYND